MYSLENNLVQDVDWIRKATNALLDPERKSSLGQFMTPGAISRYMAGLLSVQEHVRLLDAGAGVGSLSAAAVASFVNRGARTIHVVAYELDPVLIDGLQKTVELCSRFCDGVGVRFQFELRNTDFIEDCKDILGAARFLTGTEDELFTHAILNPPYKKIPAGSPTRKRLAELGLETSNIYTGFVAASCVLLSPHGELVAITPRSFCNGPYFRAFRKFFLDRMTIDHLHVYESRRHAFQEDEVLQENVIFHAAKSTERPDSVLISSSASPESAPTSLMVSYSTFIRPDDPDYIFHIVPDGGAQNVVSAMSQLTWSLKGLGLSVSTGRVVDFRATNYLRSNPETGTVPLIYPTHFGTEEVEWPKAGKKPNAIVDAEETEFLLIPNERYVLTKRFTSKEEKRRIVARVYEGSRFPFKRVGFENHVNYIHDHGCGLSVNLARGLAAYFNSSLIDSYFRLFSGHTQVNASDIEKLPYPSRQQLEHLGQLTAATREQAEIDQIVQQVVNSDVCRNVIAGSGG